MNKLIFGTLALAAGVVLEKKFNVADRVMKTLGYSDTIEIESPIDDLDVEGMPFTSPEA